MDRGANFGSLLFIRSPFLYKLKKFSFLGGGKDFL